MPADRSRAARIALRTFATISGNFRAVPTLEGRAIVKIAATLKSRPRSRGRLHWASDTGHYREVWVHTGTAAPKLFHLYFGSWGRGTRRSAYVVVFRGGSPQLEVRLSPARPSSANAERIRHRLAFFGKRYKAPRLLRDHALRAAESYGIAVQEQQAVLGSFDARSGLIRPGAREVLRRILTCALIKRSLVEAALAGRNLGPQRTRRLRSFKRKREHFAKGQRAKIDMLLDRRFEAFGRHNQLINRLHETLEAKGYKVQDPAPYDLVVSHRSRVSLIEVKGWPRQQLVGALRVAIGQLFYYSHLFKRQRHKRVTLVAAVTHTPGRDLVDFVEETAGVGLVWLEAGRRFGAGRLARQILPGLVDD